VNSQSFLGSEVLDIGIGMSLLFLFISLICAAVREGLEGWRKTRALQLHQVLRELLDDKKKTNGSGLVSQLYNHPSVYALYSGDYPKRLRGQWWRRLPSYIPAAAFSSALLDIIVHGDPSQPASDPDTAIATDVVRGAIGNLSSMRVQRAVLTAFDFAGADLAAGRKSLEDWYNAAMDRVSGWYKRRTQLILFVLGFLAALTLNIDAITIAQRLTQSKAMQSAVVGEAQLARGLAPATGGGASGGAPAAAGTGQIDDFVLRSRLERNDLLVGWKTWFPPPADKPAPPATAIARLLSRLPPLPHLFPSPQSRLVACPPLGTAGAPAACHGAGYIEYVGYKEGVQMVFGWLVTAFSVTLGAPFWFDVLNKFMVVRSTVKPHEKSREEASKDARTEKTEKPEKPDPQPPAPPERREHPI
jgi:hypothetical protein